MYWVWSIHHFVVSGHSLANVTTTTTTILKWKRKFPHKHERVAVQSSTKRPGFVFFFCVLPRVKPQHVKVNILADRPIACRNPSIEHTQPCAESGTGTDNPLESFVPVLRSCWQKHKSVDTLCTSPSFRTHQCTIQQVYNALVDKLWPALAKGSFLMCNSQLCSLFSPLCCIETSSFWSCTLQMRDLNAFLVIIRGRFNVIRLSQQAASKETYSLWSFLNTTQHQNPQVVLTHHPEVLTLFWNSVSKPVLELATQSV